MGSECEKLLKLNFNSTFLVAGDETEAMHGVIITVMCMLTVAAAFEILRRYSDHLPVKWQARLKIRRAVIAG